MGALPGMEARVASTEYTVAMADRFGTAARGGPLAQAVGRFSVRYRRTSLYVRVVSINAAIVAGATVVLAVTPATVGYPIQLQEAIVLVVGVLIVAVANALALRISFGALASVVTRMKTVDLLRPRERLPVVGGPEMRAVVAGFNQMLARLEEERRETSRLTLAALEGERRRIAQELHDFERQHERAEGAGKEDEGEPGDERDHEREVAVDGIGEVGALGYLAADHDPSRRGQHRRAQASLRDETTRRQAKRYLILIEGGPPSSPRSEPATSWVRSTHPMRRKTHG